MQNIIAISCLLMVWLWGGVASAMDIQQVKSPSGIEAWLVEEHSVPIIAMNFAFVGAGSLQDAEDREGTAYFVSGMLDEGAGDIGSEQFQQLLDEMAIRMNFDSGRDVFSGSFQTLSKNSAQAFDLLRLAINKPTFEEKATERIRKQLLTGLKFDAEDPRRQANLEWYKLAFPAHNYSRPVKGTLETIASIKREDLVRFVENAFARDNLKIAVVGDINAEELGKVLDEVFGNLPAKTKLEPVTEAWPPKGPQRKVIEMQIPQSVAMFGHDGLKRHDEDFIPGYILNHIVGGGSFASILMEEVREKRGLAYSVYSYLNPMKYGSIYAGSVATKNEAIDESLKVIREQLEKIAASGPTEKELEDAKTYLTGSYALRFDTSTKISSQLLWAQIEDLGMDYFDKRNGMIEAVSIDDLRRVATRLIKPDNLIITIVGNPPE
jgi:zinc protease